MILAAAYELASLASYDNTLDGGRSCNLIGATNDLYKESLETLVLWLQSEDPAVCFGRDQALLFVPANDGEKQISSKVKNLMLYFKKFSLVVAIALVETNLTAFEDEGVLHLCLQVNHTIRTRAVVTVATTSGSALGKPGSGLSTFGLCRYCVLVSFQLMRTLYPLRQVWFLMKA